MSLADRIAAARRRRFAGRVAEREIFAQALSSEVAPFHVLVVHGAGGVGKTTLLDELEVSARASGADVRRLDCASISPSADALSRALEPASQATGRLVLMLDSYEALAPLDEWVRTTLLPSLPSDALFVLAGRDAPSAAWRADPAFAELVRVLALRNLRPDETRDALTRRGVASEHHEALHALSHGHPLTLALIADLVDQGGAPDVALAPDVVRALLDRFVAAVPSEAHREALEIAARVRVVTEDLLAEVAPSAAGTYAWLRALSIVNETSAGLAMHEIARDAILHELRARNPERDRAQRQRVHARVERRIAEAEWSERGSVFYDSLFLLMHERGPMRAFYDWSKPAAGRARALRDGDATRFMASIERHEGPGASLALAHWLDARPSDHVVLEGDGGACLGFLTHLRLDSLDGASRDPALAALARASIAPLRAGEHHRLVRFWAWTDGYQDLRSAAHAVHSMVVTYDWMQPALAAAIVVVQRADMWRPFFHELRFDEQAEAAFDLDGRSFFVFAHDFRREPHHAWSAALAQRTPPTVTADRRVLTLSEFAREVREALRLASRPGELGASALLATRMMLEWAETEPPTGAMLVELLAVAASSLDAKDDRPRRAVELTYLRPAATQEAAAERLGLSFSTYRRQLTRGVEGVVAWLWNREVGSAGVPK